MSHFVIKNLELCSALYSSAFSPRTGPHFEIASVSPVQKWRGCYSWSILIANVIIKKLHVSYVGYYNGLLQKIFVLLTGFVAYLSQKT